MLIINSIKFMSTISRKKNIWCQLSNFFTIFMISVLTISFIKFNIDTNSQESLPINTQSGESPVITNPTSYEFELIGDEGFTPDTATISFGSVDNNGAPYITYREVDSSPSGISVMMYDGNDWVYVGARNFSSGAANPFNIVFDNQNRPYVAFRDFSLNRLSVYRFDGSNWQAINSGIPSGDPVGGELAVDSSGDIWVGYGRNSVQVRKLNQSTDTWEQIGTTGFNSGGANNTSFTLDSNDIPYIGYANVNNNNRITVHRFINNNWVLAGSAGLSDDSMGGNTKLTKDSNGNVYVLYSKNTDNGRTYVQRFDGNNWSTYGTNPISTSSTSGTWIASDSQDNIYVSYRDFGNSSKIAVHKHDGNNWSNIGGNNFSTGGILYSSLGLDNEDNLHVFYQDQSLGGYKAVAKKSQEQPIQFSVNENLLQAGLITGNEPDSENVTYAISGTDSAVFSSTPTNNYDLLIDFINPPDFENPIDNDGNNIYEIDLTITDELSPQLSQTRSVEITVLNTAEFTVSPLEQDINEGQSAPIQISLDQQPTSGVEIRLFPLSSSDLTVDTQSLFFDQTNWDQPQTVNITAIDDDIDSDRTSFINVNTYNPNSAPEYQNISTIRANVNIINDDQSLININPIDTETSEDGDTAQIEFSITADPGRATVDVDLSLDDETEGSLSDNTLNLVYGDTTTLTITGLDDDEYDPNQVYNLIIDNISSIDSNYDNLTSEDFDPIQITNIDNDPIEENLDSDNDGILNGDELNTPNNGDGNNDGILDLLQPNVITINNPLGDVGESVTLVIEISCPGTETPQILTENEFSDDADYSYPYGLLKFNINCSTSLIESYWYGIDPNIEYTPRKYGPTTPGDFSTSQWYDLENTFSEKNLIGGQNVLKISYNLTDGQLGDDTGVDGQIIDPIGLAVFDNSNTGLIRTGGF